MEQDNSAVASVNATQLPGKAWTAYIPIGLGVFFFLLMFVPLVWTVNALAGIALLTIVIVFIAYKILVVRRYSLYYDEVGVWVYSGVLPWTKGVRGVKWRDLDEAVYIPTFWSWMFKSYSIRVGHRFTKSSEIFLSHMKHGQQTVMSINEQHHELVRANALS